jgi:hypothetical protein
MSLLLLLLKDTEKVLLSHSTDTAEIHLIKEGENKFQVIWGDYVANVWEEVYADLSVALARVSTLVWIVQKQELEGEIYGLADTTKWTNIWYDALSSLTLHVDTDGSK